MQRARWSQPSGRGGPLGPAARGAGAQGCARERCLARGKWEISGGREQVLSVDRVADLCVGAFCVLVGGEAQTKVAGPRPALSPPGECRGPGHRAARPWLAEAQEAVPALVLRLCEQSLVAGSPPTHFGSLRRVSRFPLTGPFLGGPCEGSVAW